MLGGIQIPPFLFLAKTKDKNVLLWHFNLKKYIFAFNIKNIENMATATLDKPKKREIDWINPHSEEVTSEAYCREMLAAENSGFISFEEHKKNMNQWLTTKL
jgi:hypothetical protein